MRTDDIRRTYLEFFRERGHRIFPSMSLIPEDRRAPLLTTAGMVQFIPYFYGEKTMDPPRAASCQVVARTTDIEAVGIDARHQSVYEMLGNFSFGDYFKEEAIRWAWELSTGAYGLDPERMWVTVFEDDDESFAIWRDAVGLSERRIVRRGPKQGHPKEDNFWWMAGVSGPGGPNTELFYDRGRRPSQSFDDGDTTMEFWNLVFTQFEVDPDGEPIGELPAKNVDTGLGLERLAQILQGVPTAYETDSFRPILARAEDVSRHRYGADEKTDISLRILAEHFRAATFLVGDGIVPSNEGRGYVLRRIVRRAIRRSKMLGVEEVVAPQMVASVVDSFADAYPNLASQRAFVENVLAGEEESFRHTLRGGLNMLTVEIGAAIERDEARPATSKLEAPKLSGDVAFKLHDTYGFPYELTLEIAQEAGLDVDHERFEALMGEQRERARRHGKAVEVADEDALREVLAEHGASAFTGYQRDEEEAKLLAVIRDGERVGSARAGDEVEIVLDATPFYPEGGGQIGDAGVIELDGGRLEVTDTRRRLDDLIVHLARVTDGEVSPGQAAHALVDRERRTATMRSHTATHVLHATLREALGEHARQYGSLVEPGRLRFDFAHPSRVDPAVLAEVEARVNAHLGADDLVKPYETTQDEARARGAIALFEEKYGDIVRVVEIGDYSVELCGGTHVTHTSQVTAVKLLGEGSISSGVRRIEALTGAEAIEGWRRQEAVLQHIATLLRTSPDEAPARVQRLLDDLKSFEHQLRVQQSAGQRERASELAARAERVGATNAVIAEVPGMGGGDLQKLAVQVRDALRPPAAVILASASDGKAAVVAALDKETAVRVKAAEILAGAAKAIGGGAGGRPDAAIGGGKNTDGIGEALRLARAAVEDLLGS